MTADNEPRDAAELASAYLDGEVTDDERARVEADPALLAEVERLRRVRAALGQVGEAPPSARERAIAAALAEFDRSHPAAVAPAAADVVPLDRRRLARRMQLMTAVAAAAVAVIGGFVIARLGADDDDTAAVREAAIATSSADQDAAPAPAAGPAPTTATAAVPITSDSRAAEFAADAAEVRTGDVSLEAPSAAMVEDEPVEAGGAPAPTTVLRDGRDLGDLAAALALSPPPVEAVVASCERDPARLRADAAFVDAGGEKVAIVVATSDDGFAAVSLEDCTVVLETG